MDRRAVPFRSTCKPASQSDLIVSSMMPNGRVEVGAEVMIDVTSSNSDGSRGAVPSRANGCARSAPNAQLVYTHAHRASGEAIPRRHCSYSSTANVV